MNKFLSMFRRIPKVNDSDDKRRLTVLLNERPLREGFNHEHYEAVKRARQFQFDSTPQIWPTRTS